MSTGRFEVPSDKVYSTTPILPKGSYVFAVGDPKTFINMEKDDPTKIRNFGVIVAITTDLDGQKVTLPARLYFHNDGSQRMAKRFLMCTLGFIPNQKGEQDFNKTYPSLWVDPTEQTMSDAFKRVSGGKVTAIVDVKPNPETGDQQNDFRWQTVQA